MLIFRELTVRNYSGLIELIQIAPNLGAWERNMGKEGELRGEQLCFEYTGNALPKALLWMARKGEDAWVSNILPISDPKLSMIDYNSLVCDWKDTYLSEYRDGYLLEDDSQTILGLCGQSVFEKFSNFSNCANKSTGRSHPLDEQRWLDFILETIKKDCEIPTDLLKFELLENGWPEEEAYGLMLDYEYGNSAMRFAVGHIHD